jgi:hypothetical protein
MGHHYVPKVIGHFWDVFGTMSCDTSVKEEEVEDRIMFWSKEWLSFFKELKNLYFGVRKLLGR